LQLQGILFPPAGGTEVALTRKRNPKRVDENVGPSQNQYNHRLRGAHNRLPGWPTRSFCKQTADGLQYFCQEEHR
jgi:hypothetical protein